MAARDTVWVVTTEGRIEIGRPDEKYHEQLVKRLRLDTIEIQASGVIEDGRARQFAPSGVIENGRAKQLDPDWEPQVQAAYEELYPPRSD